MTLIQSGNSESGLSIRKYLFLFILFIATAFIIYAPVLHHFFVSDDFKVLYRVTSERVIFIPGFFRPLSDLTILVNFLTGGLNPVWYNSFNILVHGINGFLIYLLCIRIAGNIQERSRAVYFAILSSAFFIAYPFHNEAVVWMLGRGSGMACMFALAGFLCYYEIRKINLKIAASCLCYFVSMAAFESTMIFPLIIWLMLFFEKQKSEIKRKWAFALLVTFCLHLAFRYFLSGSILGSYGNEFFHTSLKKYFLGIAKTGGRLILPPSNNAALLTSVFILLICYAVYYVVRHIHDIKQNKIWRTIAILCLILVITCVIPFVAGVSTQTSESDRLLYFPSVFVCMIWALLIVFIISHKGLQRLLIFSTFVYGLVFLELNNLNWRKASSITRSMLKKVNEETASGNSGRIYFMNIPEEIEGAYVFRIGFSDAMKLYGFDPGRFVVINYLHRSVPDQIKNDVMAIGDTTVISLSPDIILKKLPLGNYQIYEQAKLKFTCRADDKIYFWNTRQIELFPPSSGPVP
jgi:protein O-mannosyl-transferase